MEQLPPQVQQQVAQLQQFQQQAQSLARQKQQLKINLKEVERALEELGNINEETTLYKSVGGIMLKTDLADAKEEQEDRRETLNLRIKQVERQEERINKKLEELQAKIQDAIQQQPSGKAG